MSEPFIVEGYLNLVGQEGGYADPGWDMDGFPFADKVASHFEIKPVRHDDPWHDKPYVPGDIPIGRVRITIERLEQ